MNLQRGKSTIGRMRDVRKRQRGVSFESACEKLGISVQLKKDASRFPPIEAVTFPVLISFGAGQMFNASVITVVRTSKSAAAHFIVEFDFFFVILFLKVRCVVWNERTDLNWQPCSCGTRI